MKAAVHALLAEAVDYAGLFPPAALSMSAAVRNYALYRLSPCRWALGRFVTPLVRLPEFEAEFAGIVPDGTPWRIAALGGPSPSQDRVVVENFNGRQLGRALIDVVEAPVHSADEIADRAASCHGLVCYCEIALGEKTSAHLESVQRAGARAKVRTGGANVPSIETLYAFLRTCAELRLSFKATAGLHHAVRCGEAHGFVNFTLAAVALAAGAPGKRVRHILAQESEPELACTMVQIAAGRRLFTGFGSCSFDDPLADLREMGWL